MNNLPDRIRIKDIAKLADVSVGTVDRVIHGRSGVSEVSRIRVEEILKQLNYQPNMYASALASNKKYNFSCLLPLHESGDYWVAVEKGIHEAVLTYSDFNVSVHITYYDPYDYTSFIKKSNQLLTLEPDGVMFSPTAPEYSGGFCEQLAQKSIPYIFIDSYIANTFPLAFYGQNSGRSGYFAARMLMLLAGKENEIALFRQKREGRVASNQQKNREVGFRVYMEKHHPECTITDLDLHPSSATNENNQLLNNFFLAHPNISCGITFNSKAFIIGEYLDNHQMNHFKLIGYDLLEKNIACLKKKDISFLIAQQPEVQGYSGIKSLCDHLIFKKEITQMNFMPIDLVTEETVDFYMKFQH